MRALSWLAGCSWAIPFYVAGEGQVSSPIIMRRNTKAEGLLSEMLADVWCFPPGSIQLALILIHQTSTQSGSDDFNQLAWVLKNFPTRSDISSAGPRAK